MILAPLAPEWRTRLESLGGATPDPTRLDLQELAERLRGRRNTVVAKLLDKLAHGRELAPAGEREQAIYRLVAVLADEWPDASEDAIWGLFAQSAAAMESAAPVDVPVEEQVRGKWRRLAGERATAREAVVDRTREDRHTAWAWVGVDSTLPARVADGPIVAHKGRAYFLRIGPHWAGPRRREDMPPDTLRCIAALYEIQIEDSADLIARFGVELGELVQSLAVQHTVYDAPSRRLTVAVAPIRTDLVAAREPEVETLIAALGGEYTTQLTLWLAGLLRLDHPLRALVLSGPQHTGKSLLLNGVGRLWRDGAAVLGDVLGKRFNAELARSALAIGDDDADSASADTGEALATYLRRAVTDRSQRLERKGYDVERVQGAMRYAIATNDPHALLRRANSWRLNDESLAALGSRLLHIPVSPTAREVVAGLDRAALVEGDAVARHVLWLAGLAETWVPTDRFWVGPADGTLIQLATVCSGPREDILIRLLHETRMPGVNRDPARIGNGAWMALDGERVVVSTRLMFECWGLDRPRDLTEKTLGGALHALGANIEQPKYHSRRPKLVAVPLALVEWASDYFWI